MAIENSPLCKLISDCMQLINRAAAGRNISGQWENLFLQLQKNLEQ
jgi:hypothetical protein